MSEASPYPNFFTASGRVKKKRGKCFANCGVIGYYYVKGPKGFRHGAD
jgi:hypothetical protein